MSINYEEEFLNLLKNHTIRILPSQSVIDSSEQVVKALWKNYHPPSKYDSDYHSFNFAEWYKLCNWNAILQKYHDNIPLWEELLKERGQRTYGYSENSYDYILTEDFQRYYPLIAAHFLNNNDKLIELFNITCNKGFHERIKLDENKKEDIYKMFLINSSNSVSQELITKYENDETFVQKLLTKSPTYFSALNDENKQKHAYIKLALKNMDMFFELTPEKQDIYFNAWSKYYMEKFDFKYVKKLNEKQQEHVLSHRVNLLNTAINNGNTTQKEMAMNCLTSNLDLITAFEDRAIILFTKSPQRMQAIKDQLQEFVVNYKDMGFAKKENKILLLINAVPELKQEIQQNIFYNVGQIFKSKTKLDEQWYKHIALKAIELHGSNKITDIDAENLLSTAKNCLTIPALKQLRIPAKNTYSYIKMMLLKESLEQDLPNTANPVPKAKI